MLYCVLEHVIRTCHLINSFLYNILAIVYAKFHSVFVIYLDRLLEGFLKKQVFVLCRQYALKKVQLDEQKRTRTRAALLREAG